MGDKQVKFLDSVIGFAETDLPKKITVVVRRLKESRRPKENFRKVFEVVFDSSRQQNLHQPWGGTGAEDSGRRSLTSWLKPFIQWRASERSICNAVKNAMAIVNQKGFGSVAFPVIGAGSRGTVRGQPWK